jgi:hypothetical protein
MKIPQYYLVRLDRWLIVRLGVGRSNARGVASQSFQRGPPNLPFYSTARPPFSL